MGLKYNVSGGSGNLSTLIAGTVTTAGVVFMGQSTRKVGYLSALVSLTAATSTIQLAAKWQVSNDNTTFVDVVESNNPAIVVYATGTVTIVTKTLTAPEGVYGWKYARVVVVNTVATGGVSDLYAVGYCYRQLTGSEG